MDLGDKDLDRWCSVIFEIPQFSWKLSAYISVFNSVGVKTAGGLTFIHIIWPFHISDSQMDALYSVNNLIYRVSTRRHLAPQEAQNYQFPREMMGGKTEFYQDV